VHACFAGASGRQGRRNGCGQYNSQPPEGTTRFPGWSSKSTLGYVASSLRHGFSDDHADPVPVAQIALVGGTHPVILVGFVGASCPKLAISPWRYLQHSMRSRAYNRAFQPHGPECLCELSVRTTRGKLTNQVVRMRCNSSEAGRHPGRGILTRALFASAPCRDTGESGAPGRGRVRRSVLCESRRDHADPPEDETTSRPPPCCVRAFHDFAHEHPLVGAAGEVYAACPWPAPSRRACPAGVSPAFTWGGAAATSRGREPPLFPGFTFGRRRRCTGRPRPCLRMHRPAAARGASALDRRIGTPRSMQATAPLASHTGPPTRLNI